MISHIFNKIPGKMKKIYPNKSQNDAYTANQYAKRKLNWPSNLRTCKYSKTTKQLSLWERVRKQQFREKNWVKPEASWGWKLIDCEASQSKIRIEHRTLAACQQIWILKEFVMCSKAFNI